MVRVLVLLVLLSICKFGFAEDKPVFTYLTGTQLNNECIKVKSALCDGYVMAVVDTYSDMQEVYNQTAICLRPRVTNTQLTAIVSKYLLANPEEWHFRASGIVLKALSNAFPCN